MKTSTLSLVALLAALSFTNAAQNNKFLAQTRGNSGGVSSANPANCTPIEAYAPYLEDIYVEEPTLDWCPCNETLPNLGSGVQATNSINAQVLQTTSVSSTPDVEQNTECLVECCACNEANDEVRRNAQRTRHFCIEGDISITEDIEFHELSHSREASAGRAFKESNCTLSNQGSEDLGDICISGVNACPANGGGVGSGTPGH